MDGIAVMWIGGKTEPTAALRAAAAHLRDVFGAHAALARAHDRPLEAYDARRGQHSSTAILRWLQARPRTAAKTLAVTDVDLFIPVLTFVYGEAQLGGHAAVVSTARLDAGVGGLGAARLAKESVHEVGHLFGLVHCARAACAMHRSSTLHDVDGKGATLCAECRARLREAT